MRNFNIKRQINKLYTLTTVSYFRIAGASWVALLALRGFSLLQIGVLESIFHIASSCFEIPSGVVADVFGRKRTLALSKLIRKTFRISAFQRDFKTSSQRAGVS